MMNRGVFALLVFLAGAVFAQEPGLSFKSVDIAPGIRALEGQGGFAGGNISLLTGDDGVFLIDGGLEGLTELTLAAIAKAAGKPVDFLINTHVHGDHIGNNVALHQAGATIIAHENLRSRLVEVGVMTANGPVPVDTDALPQITFADSVSFHLNGQKAQAFHVANAHTDGDSVVYFPDSNVIHAGDVFFNSLFPYIDLDAGGSVEGFLAAQARLLSMSDNDTTIISGHGAAAASKSDLQSAYAMLLDARGRVKQLLAAGKNEQEILDINPLGEYHDEWNWGFITTERMTSTLVRDLTQSR